MVLSLSCKQGKEPILGDTEFQRKLNLYVDKIERGLSQITVIGCGVKYQYDSINSGYECTSASQFWKISRQLP